MRPGSRPPFWEVAPAFEDSAAFLGFSDQAREAVGPGPCA